VAVLALVFSLVAVALPASAHLEPIDTSASCPDTIPSAGFTDIGTFDAETQAAINCLAHFGITKGTSATTFSPSNATPRWQMALFLIRQATAHGLTIPAAADQGFTDISGVSQEARDAINQLKQLGITQGTSATTFSPDGIVSRWQMALFIHRLAVAAGVTFTDDPAHSEFTDLSALLAEAQTAINALADAHIALGVGAGLFAPEANVLRWQMALFLTRLLAADGILPTGLNVIVTPTDTADLATGQARTYTATFRNDNGSPYTGRIGIQVLDTTAAGVAIFNDQAENVFIEASTDGLGGGAAIFEINGFPGTDGIVTFTVRNNGTGERVRPIAWQDLNADDSYGSGNVTPTEPHALGGVANFVAGAAADAVSGTYTGFVVSLTTKASDSFEAGLAANNCGNGAGVDCTFHYDANDIFQVGGAAATLASFEGVLSADDVLTITYNAAAAGQSTFNVTTNAVAGLTVSTPSAPTTVDANTFVISGTADPGATVRVKVDLNNDGDAADPGEGTVASVAASEDGDWSVSVNLTQNAANNFVATQQPVGGAETAPLDIPTITEGANVAAKITSTVGANGGTAGVLDPADTIVITFDEEVVGVGSGDTITLLDADGSTATLTCASGVTCSLNVAGTILTATVTNIVFASGGTTGGINPPANITAVSGFQGADGLAINVAGSGAGTVFAGF
jgi:hypothetical protein